ncbi:MAG TPA: ATP-binding protein, partial [Actinomycetota bacterium]|nr:ATP-binding protein [Actinomycetota bacterium]
ALNKMLARIEEAFGKQRASEERLRQFVADASHELRTPITSIRGWAELFRRGASEHPDDLAKAMSRIEAEADRMGFLVEDLLLLARLDQGKPLARERVDLTALVTRAVDDARAADPTRRIDLRPEPAVVEGDEPRLKQVLDNLLANVRVHTPPGTAATVTLKADGEAIVDVADEGPGVPNEIADRIFERFVRADASRGRDKGGAGLGLAIASEIVRSHRGRLELVPDARGTTFRMTLPLTSARTSDAASHIHSEA